MWAERLLRAGGLLAWAGLFGWVWLSGDSHRFVGTRTDWVVPAGAILLGLALAGYIFFARRPGGPRVVRSRDVAGLAVLLTPIVAVLATPKAELGAFAAAKKASGSRVSVVKQRVVPPKKGPLTLVDLHYATQFDDAARSVGVVAGRRVRIVGFVTHPAGSAAGTFAITRFGVACCIADAEPFSAQIDGSRLPRRDYSDDSWLAVTGTTTARGKRIIVHANSVEPIRKPRKPYFSYSF